MVGPELIIGLGRARARWLADSEFIDYYELLMVSTSADRGMIEWARHG